MDMLNLAIGILGLAFGIVTSYEKIRNWLASRLNARSENSRLRRVQRQEFARFLSQSPTALTSYFVRMALELFAVAWGVVLLVFLVVGAKAVGYLTWGWAMTLCAIIGFASGLMIGRPLNIARLVLAYEAKRLGVAYPQIPGFKQKPDAPK